MAAPRKLKHLTIEGDDAQTYEMHASHWLSKANAAQEAGEPYDTCEALYDKAQYWLDKANAARGWA